MTMNEKDLYVYELKEVVRVVDGDTYDLILDVGFHQQQASRFRLADFDTPEIFWHKASDHEKEKGQEATERVALWLSSYLDEGQSIYVRTYKSDSFGRWLAEIFVGDDILGEFLEGLGLATQWPTRWREVYDT